MKKRFGKLEANWPRLRKFLVRCFGGFDFEIYEADENPAITVIKWEGRLGWYEQGGFSSLLQGLLASDKKLFVLDLAEVTAIDIFTWRNLAKIRDEISEAGGKLQLCNIPNLMIKNLTMGESPDWLPSVGVDQAMAIESLRQSQSA